MLRVFLVRKRFQKKINASALLDSGAEGIIINTTFVPKHKLTLRTLKHLLPVKNVDDSSNKAGPICFITIWTIHIETPDKQFHKECSEFYITTAGTHDLILGTDWLKAHNLELD
jgi:hypothetical protein